MLPLKPKEMAHGAYSSNEEALSSLSHAVGAILAVFGLFWLTASAETRIERIAAWIYALSLVAMFTSSSIYHISVHPRRRAVLRKIDHIAIYLLIAGTYTPFLAVSVGSTLAMTGLAMIWFIAFSGILFKLLLGHKYPKISIISYTIMGWMALFMIYPIYQSLPIEGFLLLVAGGLCYSAGIPLYLMKHRHYSHALWHLCVAAGAACHFFAIYLYVYLA